MVDSGIILLKYWLEVGQEEQTRRIESRIDDPRKVWKLSPMDLKSYSRWYDYSRARDEMLAATSTDFAPWHIADSNEKKRARLNIISHLLRGSRTTARPRKPVVLPARQRPAATASPTTLRCTSSKSTDGTPSRPDCFGPARIGCSSVRKNDDRLEVDEPGLVLRQGVVHALSLLRAGRRDERVERVHQTRRKPSSVPRESASAWFAVR